MGQSKSPSEVVLAHICDSTTLEAEKGLPQIEE